jgi:hypothetical protein
MRTTSIGVLCTLLIVATATAGAQTLRRDRDGYFDLTAMTAAAMLKESGRVASKTRRAFAAATMTRPLFAPGATIPPPGQSVCLTG